MEFNILRAAFMANQIRRWHMLDQYQRQDVAQHSFRVAFLSAHIADIARVHGFQVLGERAFVCGAIHDLGETVTGDIPTHVKKAIRGAGVEPDVLAEREGHFDTPAPYKWIVKSADMLEAYMFTKFQPSKDSRGEQVAKAIEASWFQYFHAQDAEKQLVLRQVADDMEAVYNSEFNYDLKFPEEQ